MKTITKKRHVISNAHDAWWFLTNHPKFSVPDRVEITPQEMAELKKKHYLVSQDIGGTCYRYFRHTRREAITSNLCIFYTKVNKPKGGRVDDDKSKNIYIECWLEFGCLAYEYEGGKKPIGDWDNSTNLHNYHDIELDTGAPTFDEALIKLARLVRKHYGDFDDKWKDEKSYCKKPTCPECERTKKIMKELGT